MRAVAGYAGVDDLKVVAVELTLQDFFQTADPGIVLVDAPAESAGIAQRQDAVVFLLFFELRSPETPGVDVVSQVAELLRFGGDIFPKGPEQPGVFFIYFTKIDIAIDGEELVFKIKIRIEKIEGQFGDGHED